MTLVAIGAALAMIVVGFAAGWLLRERRTIDECREVGGQWSEVGDYCYGHPYGETQA